MLRDSVLDGIADSGADISAVSKGVLDAGPDDVEAAACTILLTPANFGAVSGLMKDFLERIYPWFEEVPKRRPGMPYALVVKGASDPSGAVRDVHKILTGLRWKEVQPPLEVVGDVADEHLAAARELGATMAAGLDAGLW